MKENKIKIMPPDLAAKIAAGEIVERPASVVKELVENSIDADANDISIYIIDGGKSLIKVSDNGEGMSREDAVLAFERHATSKILKEGDLYSISTMGFRGEALPSIASVSDMTLTTKTAGEIAGTQIKIKAGKIEDVSDFGAASGTTVEARDLFFNVPARLKFLRSKAAEIGNIQDAVNRLSLANPDIRFKLTHGKTVLLDTAKGSDLKTRICDVIGNDAVKEIIPIERKGEKISVHGFVSNSNVTYPTTKGMFIFVNKRWIRDKGINYAVLQAYKNILMTGRYPLAVLFISIPPEDVDVNVHPSKNEVRFKNPRFIYDVLTDALKNGFSQKNYPEISFAASIGNTIYADEVRESAPHYQEITFAGTQTSFFEKYSAKPDAVNFDELNFIGQLWDEYIICQNENRFYIIDQHAAAERIAFERLKHGYYGSGIKTQMLLVPEMLDVSIAEKDALETAAPIIKRFGFDIEPFGGNTFAIKAVPEILSGNGCGSLIKDMAEEIYSLEKTTRIEDSIDEMLIKIACFSVIRGRYLLTRDKVKSLLKQLEDVDFAANCPHGRPVIKDISRFEIEKMFKRR